MTKRQIQKMLLAEGMGYAICSIAASFLFGTALSYAMFDQLCRVGTASYAVPWVQDLALFAAAMLLCMLLPGFIYRRTQKESLIERLSKGDARYCRARLFLAFSGRTDFDLGDGRLAAAL